MRIQDRVRFFSATFLLFLLFHAFFTESGAHGRLLPTPKPDRNNAAASARWLVSQNSWGVLSTISRELNGAPFGNVVSYSDGFPNKGKGIPYFYQTMLDPTARNALQDQRASLTVSENPIGTCKTDPMDPTCAKLTLMGKLLPVDKNSEEAVFARNALFTKHLEMKDWPVNHDFRIFKLEIANIFLINWYGGPKPLTVDEYLNFKLSKLSFGFHEFSSE